MSLFSCDMVGVPCLLVDDGAHYLTVDADVCKGLVDDGEQGEGVGRVTVPRLLLGFHGCGGEWWHGTHATHSHL